MFSFFFLLIFFYFFLISFRPSSCRAQLEKMGLGSDECKEVLERLLNIKYK